MGDYGLYRDILLCYDVCKLYDIKCYLLLIVFLLLKIIDIGFNCVWKVSEVKIIFLILDINLIVLFEKFVVYWFFCDWCNLLRFKLSRKLKLFIIDVIKSMNIWKLFLNYWR